MTPLQSALAREHYVDESFWRHERDHVLANEWTCIGRLDDLELTVPGSSTLLPQRMAVVDLLGESVVVTTDAARELHAHFNVCRHRGSQLVPVDPAASAPSPCAVKAIRCPYHSWTYGLDGSLLHAPHTTDLDTAAFALHPVAADTWGGWLWLNWQGLAAAPLMDELAGVAGRLRRYPLADLVLGRRYVYDVHANWKVIAENYNECYHCGPVHPELSRLVPEFAGGGSNLDWENGIPHREGAWTFTFSGSSDRAPFPDLDEHELVRHKGELVYPNLLLSLAAEHVAAFVVLPQAVDRTSVVCDLLFAVDEVAKPGFDPSDAGDFWDLVNKQDWAICESVQRGMTSKSYGGGWYAPMEDESLDIRRWLLSRLAKSPPIRVDQEPGGA